MNASVGVIGLGVMGRNLAQNLAEHGFSVAGLDRDAQKASALVREGQGAEVRGFTDPDLFLDALARPRVIILLVPAGAPVDAVIGELKPKLAPTDTLVDAGNSHFCDTERRQAELEGAGIFLIGMGTSGGESGARHGPSLMGGGSKEAWSRVSDAFEAISAHVGSDPCAAYLGPKGAGHYVKMVHNGIEYGLMQSIADSYALLKHLGRFTDEELADLYGKWNEGEMQGYLLEITSQIFRRRDEKTGKPLIELVLDVARQKGTGAWTSEEGMHLGVPIPTIDAAVSFRNLSALQEERLAAERLFPAPPTAPEIDRDLLSSRLEQALSLAMALIYAEGMSLLQRASSAYSYGLPLETVARIWRGGCIIRSRFLEELRQVYSKNPNLANPLLDADLAAKLRPAEKALREACGWAAQSGVPAAALQSALWYWDAYRAGALASNLIQLQRDYFGAHTYERVDRSGIFHTEWEERG